MAVRLDIAAVKNAVEQTTYQAAVDLLDGADTWELSEIGGGIAAVVPGGDGERVEVWAGVRDGALIAECTCPAAQDDPADLCVHGVAVTLCAIDEGFAWSSDAVPPSVTAADPDVLALLALAERLPHQRLALLVAEFAARDERLADRLCALAAAPIG